MPRNPSAHNQTGARLIQRLQLKFPAHSIAAARLGHGQNQIVRRSNHGYAECIRHAGGGGHYVSRDNVLLPGRMELALGWPPLSIQS